MLHSSKVVPEILWLLCCFFMTDRAICDQVDDNNRPYEFSFNIVDFQHRYEKKDENGIVTGEYGFITADGVYHETGYATDENGDFLITRMKNRKITSLKDAQEIFKDRPEAAKKLLEAVAKACSGCKIPLKQDKPDAATVPGPRVTESPNQKKMGPVLKEMMKTLTESIKREENKILHTPKSNVGERKGKELSQEIVRNMVDSAKKVLREQETEAGNGVNDSFLENMANDLYYRFNYTITSHGHQEDGYRSGRKDGSYRAQSENGVDTQVRYLSNEFGHQPNISFVSRDNSTDEEQALKGYSFLWYWL